MTLLKDDFIRESKAVYHATEGYMSSHRLSEFRRCPYTFRQRQLGNLPPIESPAFAFGQAAHTLILEGIDVYDDEVVAGGPINPKTGRAYGRDTEAFSKWAAEQTAGVIVTAKEDEMIRRMARSVRHHPVAADILERGLAERVIRRNMYDVPFQCRIDWLTEIDNRLVIADLKTCEELDWFEFDAKKFGYAYQLALYRSMLAAHTKQSEDMIDVYLIAVEKRDCNRCGVWKIDNATLDRSACANEFAARRYAECVENDSWPTPYESQRVLTT